MNMETRQLARTIKPPSYVVEADGQATAVLVDIATWQRITAYLEDAEDNAILRAAATDLAALAQGQRPDGWKSWEEFEAELDALEATGEIPA